MPHPRHASSCPRAARALFLISASSAPLPAIAQSLSAIELARQKALASSASAGSSAPAGLALAGARRKSGPISSPVLDGVAAQFSVSSLLDPEFVAPPTIAEAEAAQQAGDARSDGSAQPPESAIERARRLNYDASIARGDAPKCRPSKDVAAYVHAGRTGPAHRPTVSELLGH